MKLKRLRELPRHAAMAACVILLGGCALPERLAAAPAMGESGRVASPVGALAQEGVALLRAGRPEAATVINRSLALMPAQAELHLLAGLAYHRDFLRGNHLARDLAETGYVTASQLDPSLLEASLQLGRLHLDAKRHPPAQVAFLRVLDIDPNHVEALHGLAIASYYARDLRTALGAVQRLTTLNPDDKRAQRAAAFIYTAAGLPDEAAGWRARYGAVTGAPADLEFVDRRLGQWRAMHADNRLLRVRDGEPVKGAVAADEEGPARDKAGPATDSMNGPLSADWADCKQRVTEAGEGDGAGSDSGSSETADETRPLPALPSPCGGRPLPRMVAIDATIIRSEEMLTSTRGINLLDGLQLVFTWSNLITRTITDGSPSTTDITNRGVGLPAAGVAYALNIANASDLRNDVLARPSLVALDRRPSMFFSGSNLTIAVSGQFEGDLEEKPIGISLSVTPTFISDDTLLLAVKAARSDIENFVVGSFNQSLHTTRSSVTTNVMIKMNQTLVLSGLVEKTSETNRSRTPLLGDVPLVQYLFNSAKTEEVQRSILVVLTPRRTAGAVAQNALEDTAMPPYLAELRERLGKSAALSDNTVAAIRALASNRYVNQFHSGDLRADDWKSQDAMNRLLNGLSSYLYY